MEPGVIGQRPTWDASCDTRTTAGPTGRAVETPPALRIASATHVRTTADGELELRLICAGGDPAGCHGQVSLRSARRISSRYLSRGRSRVVSLGTRPFAIRSGASATVTIRLSRDTLALLRRMQTMRVLVRVTATDRAGRRATAARLISLHAPRRHRAG